MNISKHKSGYYYIYYYDESEEKRRSISTKTKVKSDALIFLSNFNQELRKRQRIKTIPITLDQFILKFLVYSSSIHTIKTTKGFKSTFTQLKKYLGSISGSMQLNLLTSKIIEEYIQNRILTRSIYAARKDLIHLSSAFNKAVKEKFLIENLCKNIKRIRVPQKQPNYFSESDYQALLDVVEDMHLRNIIEIALNTGLRQMEILTLRWNQINLKDKYLVLTNQTHLTKGKKIRSIPLNSRVFEIFTDLRLGNQSDFVFTKNNIPFTQDYISRQFKKCVKKTNIDQKLNFHSLRHTFASWLVQKGVSIYQVSKLLGHADIKTTEIYSHLRAEDLRGSVDVLNSSF